MENNKFIEEIKIAAVVVTYNRLELLKQCINSIKEQTRKLDEIIVVNNSSSDGTFDWLEAQSDITVITQENSGSAGGQHTGIKTAYEKGYDWIWCMDDDSEPSRNALEKLSKKISTKYSAITPQIVDSNEKELIYHRGNFNFNLIMPDILQLPTSVHKDLSDEEIEYSSFVGILINRLAIGVAGFPKSEFFIHHDDVEYCIRLKKYGKILFVKSAIIIHKEVNNSGFIKKKFLGKVTFRPPIGSYWIRYYSFRNHFWLVIKYINPKRKKILSIFLALQREIRRIILYDSYKLKRIRLIIQSLSDVIRNNFSRSVHLIKNI